MGALSVVDGPEDGVEGFGEAECDILGEARVVAKHGVHSGDEWLAAVITALEMPSDDVLGHRQPTLVKAFGAPDAGLLADAPDPLVAAGRLIPGLACPAALESAGIDVFPPEEEAME